MVELREWQKAWQGDSRVLVKGIFLMGLRHWILVQCETLERQLQGMGICPDGEISFIGAFEWDASEQKMVDNHRRFSHDASSFYETAETIVCHFATSIPRPEDVPEELYYYKEE